MNKSEWYVVPNNYSNMINGLIKEATKVETVNCANCGWSWDTSEGGKDPYVCHKCGHNNAEAAQSSDKAMSVKEAINNLTTDEIEQLQEYAASLKEIQKEMKKLIAKGRQGTSVGESTVQKEAEQGGDMMNLTMPTEE